MSAPTDLVRESWYDRAVGTEDLTSLLGHTDENERIYWGRPEKVHGTRPEDVAASEHPYITFFTVPGREVVKGVGRVRVQVDMWVWADTGGIGQIKEIDEIIYDQFYEERWEHGSNRFHCGSTSWRQDPPRASNVLHRVRELGIGVHDRAGT